MLCVLVGQIAGPDVDLSLHNTKRKTSKRFWQTLDPENRLLAKFVSSSVNLLALCLKVWRHWSPSNTQLFPLIYLLSCQSRSCLGQTWVSDWRFRTWTRLPQAHPWGTHDPEGCHTCRKSPWAPPHHCSPEAPSPAPWPSCRGKLGSWMRATACGVHISQS